MMRPLYLRMLTAGRSAALRSKAAAGKVFSRCVRSGAYNAAAWAVILLASFGAVLMCNLVSDYKSDDHLYLCKIELNMPLDSAHEPLQGFADIVRSQYNHYLSVNGRATAHFFLQTALYYFDQNTVDIICSLFTVALVLMISYCAAFGEDGKRSSKTRYITVFSLLILLNPAVSDTIYWTTGIFNYNFTALLVICFIAPYLMLLDRGDINRPLPAEAARALALAALGVLSGWTNENIAPSLVCTVALILLHRGYFRKNNLCFSDYAGLAGAAAGCCMLLLAPANFVRSESIAEKNDVYSQPMKLAIRLYYMERALFIYMFGAAALLAALLIVNRLFLRRRLTAQSKLLIFWAVLSYAAMIMSPSYPPRAVFGTLVIMLIPVSALISRLKNRNRAAEMCVSAVSVMLFLSALSNLLTPVLYSIYKIEP